MKYYSVSGIGKKSFEFSRIPFVLKWSSRAIQLRDNQTISITSLQNYVSKKNYSGFLKKIRGGGLTSYVL